MENICLINVYVDSVVLFKGLLGDIVLNGGDIVVDEKLFALFVTGKASYSVINGNDIGIKAADKIIK